jgi:hypothetical protein
MASALCKGSAAMKAKLVRNLRMTSFSPSGAETKQGAGMGGSFG